mmetsp:Transcript_587/g.2111  ORF Transcript_587/g.2111 Transcript_587/m.2111 type:complete len:138 (-) Transcript_587:88-501(-)
MLPAHLFQRLLVLLGDRMRRETSLAAEQGALSFVTLSGEVEKLVTTDFHQQLSYRNHCFASHPSWWMNGAYHKSVDHAKASDLVYSVLGRKPFASQRPRRQGEHDAAGVPQRHAHTAVHATCGYTPSSWIRRTWSVW